MEEYSGVTNKHAQTDAASATHIDDELWSDFVAETEEHLQNIEECILRLEQQPADMEIIHSLFRAFHTIKGLAGFVEQSIVQEIAHHTETVLHACRSGEQAITRHVIDMMLKSVDLIDRLCHDPSLGIDTEFVALSRDHSTALDSEGQDGKDMQPGEGIAPLVAAEASERNGRSAGDNGLVRIPAAKVDTLANLLSELIVVQSQLEQSLSERFAAHDGLQNDLTRMARITKELQNVSMSMRMISLKPTFQKVTRIARDALVELGKNVHIVTSGEETEIDRSVAEKLVDPLLHLVKNSVAHGIELAEERLQSGKAAEGTVRVTAHSKRGNVYITISDDGQGINLQKVLQKAIERGLADAEGRYSDEEITQLIFVPGFSTSETVDSISGRGVGLDVVQSEIGRLGGRIDVRSQSGQGTEFALKIPINQAVTNGTILTIGGKRYIIPTLFIKRIINVNQDVQETEWVHMQGRCSAIRVKEAVIPVIDTGPFLGDVPRKLDEANLVVVLEVDQELRALPVESILGKRELVVKPLSWELRKAGFLAGASILGDGKLALVLDVESLFRMGDER